MRVMDGVERAAIDRDFFQRPTVKRSTVYVQLLSYRAEEREACPGILVSVRMTALNIQA
jgi:hypothetical protein